MAQRHRKEITAMKIDERIGVTDEMNHESNTIVEEQGQKATKIRTTRRRNHSR
jgi:hypothetical protein